MSVFAGLPQGHYRAISADPPWHFKSNSRSNPGRNALRHYDCMSLDEIAALPVRSLAAPDCALWLWITGPMMVAGAHLTIFRAWGFKPSGMGFVWVKLNPKASRLFFVKQDLAMGGGFTTRKNAEFCLIGKKGRSVRRCANVHEIIIDPRREHSRKPEDFYDRVEQYTAGPYLDLFSREARPGWDNWGNEATKFNEAAE
ncbi:MAG TPA: MT-A70 family methyltransferase [Xanthobacteraceae bacterium]|nr:MT-A70 family methyltransferase [Xanthobacteraceae bacterium]